jgi:hypothetical protein
MPQNTYCNSLQYLAGENPAANGEVALHALMQEWTLEGAERHISERLRLHRSATRKKRSSQASCKTCGLGTPFPRSALFLLMSLWKIVRLRKVT